MLPMCHDSRLYPTTEPVNTVLSLGAAGRAGTGRVSSPVLEVGVIQAGEHWAEVRGGPWALRAPG